METDTAETVVKVFAILSWVGAAFAIILGLLFIVGGAALGSLFTGGEMGNIFALIGAVLGVLLILMAILEAFIGYGLWKHQNWARIITLIFAWISGVFALLGLMIAVVGLEPFGMTTNLFSIAIAVLEIWLFQFEPAVVGLFTQNATPAAAPARAAKAR